MHQAHGNVRSANQATPRRKNLIIPFKTKSEPTKYAYLSKLRNKFQYRISISFYKNSNQINFCFAETKNRKRAFEKNKQKKNS